MLDGMIRVRNGLPLGNARNSRYVDQMEYFKDPGYIGFGTLLAEVIEKM